MHEKSTRFAKPSLRFALVLCSGLGLACPAFGQTAWTARPSGVTSTLRQVAFGDGVFLAVGNGGVLLRSANGTDWERVTSPTADALFGVCHGRGLFVAVGQGGRILCSPDGFLWFNIRVEATALNSVTFANSRFVAAGGQGKIFVSDDGLTWIQQTTPTAVELTDLASYGGRMVAVGFFATAWTSRDGELWSPQAISGFPSFTSIRHFGHEFIATVGSGASMYRSTNGLHWQSTANGTGARLNALAKGLDALVTVGFDQTIFSSTNGVDWTERHRGEPIQLLGAAYGNNTFVVVGERGAIFSSPETALAASVVSLEVLDALASEARDEPARVRLNRAGDPGQPATVTLQIGGTATPGVDFFALPTTVVLPAGVSETHLTITPIADEQSETREIVALSIGSAEGASVNPLAQTVAVFLTDASEPDSSRLSAVAGTPARGAMLQLRSVAGTETPLQTGTNFLAWEALFPVRNPFGQVLFTDPAAPNFNARYYRVEP